jgi:hypothetical protein
VFALGMAIAHGALGGILRGAFGWLWPRQSLPDAACDRARLYLPYGVPIAVGALLTFYSGVLAS